jgi:hypothetical protein
MVALAVAVALKQQHLPALALLVKEIMAVMV